MSSFDQRLEELLVHLVNNFEPLYIKGERVNLVSTEEEMHSSEAKQAIKKLFLDEVVGKNVDYYKVSDKLTEKGAITLNISAISQNDLRLRQRSIINGEDK